LKKPSEHHDKQCKKQTYDFESDRDVDLAARVFKLQFVFSSIGSFGLQYLKFAHVRFLRHADIVVRSQSGLVLEPLAGWHGMTWKKLKHMQQLVKAAKRKT
jgi:hypothetical protein